MTLIIVRVPSPHLDRRLVNLSLQAMNTSTRFLKSCVVMGVDCVVAPGLQRFDARFDCRFIDAYNVVVLMHLDAECLANRHDQMFLIELRVALNSVVLNVLGDVAKFRERLVP